jgi:HSP90 family molecular chaperone
MTTQELKVKLIDRINKSENKEMLEDISRLMEGEENPVFYELSSKQKQVIGDAVKDVEMGNYLTEKQANDEIDEWLGK